MPIRLGDGTRIIPQGFEEIRNGAGDVLFAGIPDSGDLVYRYDFKAEDGSLPVEDQTNNGNPLDQGSLDGVGGDINGFQAGKFVKSNNDQIHGNTDTLTEPSHVFVVLQLRSVDSNDLEILFADTDRTPQTYANNGSWGVGTSSGGSPDTNPHVLTLYSDGGNSYLRVDGTQVASDGDGSLDSFSLAGVPNEDYSDLNVGEVLAYDKDKRGIETDIENYLGDRWGITI